jgi:predicted DNA-binding transcriptional regulator YafY
MLILERLRQNEYITSKELMEYVNKRLIANDMFPIGSKKTLQRDIEEIEHLFGILIEYDQKERGYSFIDKKNQMDYQRWIDDFELLNSLNVVDDAKQYIFLEQRKPQGIENIYGLLHCIKNKYKINIVYQTFSKDEPANYTIEPIGLKEFKNRWYVLVKYKNTRSIRRFAFDRILKMDITSEHFTNNQEIDVNEYYQYCFGIVGQEGQDKQVIQEPKEIVLSFDVEQGKYTKSLPLHHSQEIIIDNDQELRIKLKLYVTFDFVMELLSYSEKVRVIKPQSLIDEIRRKLLASLANYDKLN